MNKKKIFNDPIYGFINVPNELIFDIIQHPYFQRLRRIKQLGLTDMVYPGALHTRFNHAMGAMHLMDRALESLKSKGHVITDSEKEAALIAILLHDIGHGPFSHTLEFSLFKGIKHEQVSGWILRKLNEEFKGSLDLAIQIFEGNYPRQFFLQLVSSQLDIDRLDYLQRDSFFTGVNEGSIGADRIIKMLDVINDELVVEEKGIYSIESFLSARRLMYWQVYLHKTSIGVEQLLIQIIKRAKKVSQQGIPIEATPSLKMFLERNITNHDFEEDPDILEVFMLMDDTDIWGSIKFWMHHKDRILNQLANRLIKRRLFNVRLFNEKISKKVIEELREKVSNHLGVSLKDAKYFVTIGHVTNSAYVAKNKSINILTKQGEIMDVAKATDLPNIKAISKIVKKYYLCWPKEIDLPNISVG